MHKQGGLCSTLLVLAPLDGLDVDALLHHLPQWAHLAQLLHMRHRKRDRAVHLFCRCEAPQAEPAAPGVTSRLTAYSTLPEGDYAAQRCCNTGTCSSTPLPHMQALAACMRACKHLQWYSHACLPAPNEAGEQHAGQGTGPCACDSTPGLCHKPEHPEWLEDQHAGPGGPI